MMIGMPMKAKNCIKVILEALLKRLVPADGENTPFPARKRLPR